MLVRSANRILVLSTPQQLILDRTTEKGLCAYPAIVGLVWFYGMNDNQRANFTLHPYPDKTLSKGNAGKGGFKMVL